MVVENSSSQQPTISNLLKQLINDLNSLMCQHVELFRVLIREDVEAIAKYIIVAFIGILLSFTALIFFGFFIIFTLYIVLPLWASSLIVTFIYMLLGIISFIITKRYLSKAEQTSEDMIDEPKKTMEEAKKWLHQLK